MHPASGACTDIKQNTTLLAPCSIRDVGHGSCHRRDRREVLAASGEFPELDACVADAKRNGVDDSALDVL
jgi:hypothetical protein